MPPLIDLRSGKTKKIATIFEVTELIGSGHFAEVYKAYNLMSKTDLALKIYLVSDERTGDIARGEIELLQKLEELKTDYFPYTKGGLRLYKAANRNHPFIPMELCEYIGDEESPKSIVSLKDIMPEASLETKPKKEIPELWEYDSLIEFILCLCDAVHMLHKQDIIHRDLKPANVLLKKNLGERTIKPFFIDFNTSSRSGSQLFIGGTASYLPPEVVAEKRKLPDPADDLWAIAKIVFELFFGKGQKIAEGLEPHALINFPPPDELTELLLKALSPKPNDRFSDTEEFRKAFENCLSIDELVPEGTEQDDSHISSDEIIWVRENKSRILSDVIVVLSGDNEIPVFKEIKDRVSFIYSSLSQSDSRSFNLKDEIVRLGTNAIPAIIEECYKLIPDSTEFTIISNALKVLATQKLELAKRAIEIFCVSSDYSVRKMCRVLCDKIHFFPTNLIDSIIENDALYLQEERVEIADICIKWSNDHNVMMSLNRYMCREYILDQQHYRSLREKIALRVKELNFEEKAGLIVGDTKFRIWEELPEYENLDEKIKKRADRGLLELFADAFSCLDEEALNYIQQPGLPLKCHKNHLSITQAFCGKLAKRYAPARKWLFNKIERQPSKEYFFAARKLKDELSYKEKEIINTAASKLNIEIDSDIDFSQLFEKYLNWGYPNDRYTLSRKGGTTTINLIENKIIAEKDHRRIEKILTLLEFFRNKHRIKIVDLLIKNWATFSEVDYGLSVYVLKEYNIPNDYLKRKAIDLLQLDIDNPERQDTATKAIDKLLR